MNRDGGTGGAMWRRRGYPFRDAMDRVAAHGGAMYRAAT
jgi:hypothetical protein